MSVKEEFSKIQMFKLKELHEEIDMFMEQFRAKNTQRVLIDDVKGKIPPKRKSMVKKRTVWGMNEAKIEYYRKEVMRYESRVLQITGGKPVLSISNKLMYPILNVSYFMVKSNEGNQSRKIAVSRLHRRKEQIETLFEKTLLRTEEMVDYLKEYELVKKVIGCAEKHKRSHMTLRTPVNDVRFYGYDGSRRIVTVPEGEHFRGGIIINDKAQEVEVFSPYRKERSTKIQENEKIYIDEYSYFVCKGQQGA